MSLTSNLARGLFVTGTGTGVGKTLVAALLTSALEAGYWKPVQTGLADEAGDTATVASLTGLPPERLIPPHACFDAPLSPLSAMRLEGRKADMDHLSLPECQYPLIVEGAGGLMVPLDDHTLMIDLPLKLELPVILVAGAGLGSINHSLLSIEALRTRGIPLAGLVISGPSHNDDAQIISQFAGLGPCHVLPHLTSLDQKTIKGEALRLKAYLLSDPTGPS